MMKVAAIAVLFTLAVIANSCLAEEVVYNGPEFNGRPFAYTAKSGQYFAAPYFAAGYPYAPYFAGAPFYAGAPFAAPYVAAVAPQGDYVAQNRGAVHVAPLPGHAESARSVNVEPAPGTF